MAMPKKPAASKAAIARAIAAATPVEAGEKRGHPVAMRLIHDGEVFDLNDGKLAYVTEAEFDILKIAQVFDIEDEWADGELQSAPPEAPVT